MVERCVETLRRRCGPVNIVGAAGRGYHPEEAVAGSGVLPNFPGPADPGCVERRLSIMRMRITPRRQAIIWGSLGVAMLLFGLWRPWFIVEIGGFRFPLGILLVAYAGLQYVTHRLTRTHTSSLTMEELQAYGGTLEAATPEIVELLSEGRGIQPIAKTIKERHSVPEDVTMRYIVAVLEELKRQQDQLLVERSGESDEESSS